MPLFLDIIQINHIRSQAATDPLAFLDTSIQASAALVLNHIDSFSSETWLVTASEAAFPNEWLLIARIFHSAVALYAISALPWAEALPPVPFVGSLPSPEHCSHTSQVMRSIYRARLFALLGTALESPIIQKGMVWPLVVAGVSAAVGPEEERVFVEHHLSQLSQSTGTSYPLVAKGALEKFWGSGLTSWDDCFDQPYAILA
jgi:hypothetical protein